MIEINILPKEYRRRARTFHFDKKTIYSAVGVGALVLLFVAVTFFQRYQLSSLDDSIALASAERTRLEKDIRLIDDLTVLKERILMRMDAIENLDRDRAVWVNLLQDMNQRVPDFLWLTRVAEMRESRTAQQARNVPGQTQADTATIVDYGLLFDKPVPTELEGYAFTLSSIASLMVGLTKSDYFDNIELHFAKEEQVTGVSAYKFKVGCDLVFDKISDDDIPIENIPGPAIAER
jgi:Tfp pilus assembly protein PilN